MLGVNGFISSLILFSHISWSLFLLWEKHVFHRKCCFLLPFFIGVLFRSCPSWKRARKRDYFLFCFSFPADHFQPSQRGEPHRDWIPASSLIGKLKQQITIRENDDTTCPAVIVDCWIKGEIDFIGSSKFLLIPWPLLKIHVFDVYWC